jgi:thiamine-phosphate pyrophosphorylase
MLARFSCQTEGVSHRHDRLARARLYLVCDARPDEFLQAALRGGVDIVQLRMKEAAEDEVMSAGLRYRELCSEQGALFILNDRPDLAARMDADGVHVGQDDASVTSARALVGPDRLVGLSTHTPAQVREAAGVDYIGVGPVHATPTKPGRPAVGLELVRHAAEHATVPFFAIGGISALNVAAVVGAGAVRIAVVRALTEAEDPERAARTLRRALEVQAHAGACA